jgi:hypothetical protein
MPASNDSPLTGAVPYYARRETVIGAAAEFIRERRAVFITFAASRAIIFTTIVLSQLVFGRGQFWYPGGLLSVLLHWDGERWYLDIARHGYYFLPGEFSNVAFFPVYPLLIKLVGFVFHDLRVAAVIVSNSCLLGAALLLHTLIRIDYKNARVADSAVTLLMFSPVSFFFSSAYTESTFLLLAVGAFLAARRNQWLIACLCGAALSATRNVGVLIALPLLLEFVRQSWRPGAGLRSLLTPRILLLGLIPCGLGFFVLFNYLKFGEPLAFLKAGATWGRKFASPMQTFATTLTGAWGVDAAAHEPFHRTVAVTALSAGILLWAAGIMLKVRASYSLYAALLIAVYLCSNSLEAMGRYMSVVFPLFLVAALLAVEFRQIYKPMLATSVAALTVLTVLQANGFWIT